MIYYQDKQVTSLQGHVLTELKTLPSESAHCFITSIPYWSLRDYDLPPQIWSCDCDNDHSETCEHEWEASLEPGGNGSGQTFRRDRKAGRKRDGQQPGFCRKCNAWCGSLGLEPTIDLYTNHIVQVFKEVWRVGRKDMTVFLNIGDSYASGKGTCFNPGGGETSFSAYRARKNVNVIPLDRKNISTLKKSGLKPKDLCMVPAHIALALQADGWYLRSDIIWNKPNPMPESCIDRPTKSHEYIFLLTKSGKPQFWTHRDYSGTRKRPKADWRWVNQITKEEVAMVPDNWKEKIICPNCEGKGRAMIDLSYECLGIWTEYFAEDECPMCEGKKRIRKWKRINLWKRHDYFYDAEAVKEELSPNTHSRGKGGKPKMTMKKIAKRGDGIKNNDSFQAAMCDLPPGSKRNLRTVWTIATEATPEAHFATFPSQLCDTAIKAGTSEKGCCPECGAPWTRVVEKMDPETRSVKSEYPGNHTIATKKYKHDESGPQSKTISWKPSCSCEHINEGGRTGQPWQPIPCTVVDPFSGSGRTLIRAKELGRYGIGIDLKEEYLKMPLKKLAQERLL